MVSFFLMYRTLLERHCTPCCLVLLQHKLLLGSSRSTTFNRRNQHPVHTFFATTTTTTRHPVVKPTPHPPLHPAGNFEWRVHGWSKLKHLQSNEAVVSDVWEAGGHLWQLRLYPGRCVWACLEWLGVAVGWLRQLVAQDGGNSLCAMAAMLSERHV